MLKLPMTPLGADVPPAVALKPLDKVPDLHDFTEATTAA
jgi:hypothetical protein